jgi:hypothetical protein
MSASSSKFFFSSAFGVAGTSTPSLIFGEDANLDATLSGIDGVGAAMCASPKYI